jgi:site-specific DNA-cytosine methylase
MGVSENVTGALRAQEHGHQPAVCYGISSYESNAMKSANPHSGVYEAETSRTLDLNGGNPACNQGGIAVVCHDETTEPIPINTMVATRTTEEKRTTMGVGMAGEPQYSLSAAHSHAVCVENHPNDSRVKISEDGKVQTLSSRMGTGGGNVPMVMEPMAIRSGQVAQTRLQEKVGALNCMHDQQAVITYGLDRASFNQGINAKYDFAVDEEKIGTQVAKGPGAVCTSVVRRLTPMECERLQGFPDHWTDIGDWVDSKGKKHKGESDSPRYKALGNSIALPFWQWMAEKMVKYVDEQTMASLFDGIGGFPLVFSRCGCTPVWASEIEEFPIAVTKIRFPE